ncbi:glycosyltransferase family 2 protein [Dactylosporangium sp. CA-139114]|uniref:glycosyltransferase family 2 protein n=1 Tax=Dactylosporangium sp. CA-139114 TaxID=3239931 RepID=UPI003D9713A8
MSVVIPYKQRLENLRSVFASLAEQTMDRSEFEVVVGALEYCPGYLALCREYADRLTIVSVLADREWNTGHARNIALRQASGEILVLLDADVALPPNALRGLRTRYFADGREICVLGQLIGYDVKVDRSAVAAASFDRHRAALAELDAARGLRQDERWLFEPVRLPWTMVWTGFVAVSGAPLRRHELWFDEGFQGWGGEDQEWGYRLGAAGVPIVLGEDVYGLHLPHVRDVASNAVTFDANKWYFLSKWPRLDVELFRSADSWEANRAYPQFRREVEAVLDRPDRTLGVVRGAKDGEDLMVVGVQLDDQLRVCDPELDGLAAGGYPQQTVPVVGIALPFPDGSVARCRLTPRVLRLGERYREMVLREARRVGREVLLPA